MKYFTHSLLSVSLIIASSAQAHIFSDINIRESIKGLMPKGIPAVVLLGGTYGTYQCLKSAKKTYNDIPQKIERVSEDVKGKSKAEIRTILMQLFPEQTAISGKAIKNMSIGFMNRCISKNESNTSNRFDDDSVKGMSNKKRTTLLIKTGNEQNCEARSKAKKAFVKQVACTVGAATATGFGFYALYKKLNS